MPDDLSGPAELPALGDLPIDVPEHLRPPPGDGLEPAFDYVTEYEVTGLKGVQRVRFGVIIDRGPGSARRQRRQNEAILDALRWIRDHPEEAAEIKRRQAERDAQPKSLVTYTPVEPAATHRGPPGHRQTRHGVPETRATRRRNGQAP
jgi:hypothetical protein